MWHARIPWNNVFGSVTERMLWKITLKIFSTLNKCPNHWFVLPLHGSRSFHSAITVMGGIYWVHSCKCSLRGTNRLLKTKLRSRNLSACHLYYLFFFLRLPPRCVWTENGNSAKILHVAEIPVTWKIILSSYVQQCFKAAGPVSCGLLCAHLGVRDGKRQTCMLGVNMNPKDQDKTNGRNRAFLSHRYLARKILLIARREK